MAQNTDLDSLLQNIPLGELAAKFGVDENTIGAAVQQALPGLIGGMAVNASDADGASKLESALQKHQPADGAVSLENIDTADGEKIVKHVLGDKQEQVAQALGEQAGNNAIATLVPQLLPMLAPLVMQFLAGKMGGGQGTVAASNDQGGLGGVLGNLLGGLVGGGQQTQQASAGGGLGDLLGGLLGGGGQQQSAGGGLGDLLGGLLGGKK
ncbi:DUF937 domain-containing protein [Leucobacter chromiireducens]|uniref:DUF937 domain-containing protein n=1 Tax=Leucobacter chromiireducens subsp. solipictus TaxID=398235 RepID=A0ABS1SGK9_9MICO|nr:DUF937 domain-containing protein [Leucobacter chromiireducens]MBL3679665.1 DUF937 domain-containing protein [Leucobacter chromiireducens subsp. solipictus]